MRDAGRHPGVSIASRHGRATTPRPSARLPRHPACGWSRPRRGCARAAARAAWTSRERARCAPRSRSTAPHMHAVRDVEALRAAPSAARGVVRARARPCACDRRTRCWTRSSSRRSTTSSPRSARCARRGCGSSWSPTGTSRCTRCWSAPACAVLLDGAVTSGRARRRPSPTRRPCCAGLALAGVAARRRAGWSATRPEDVGAAAPRRRAGAVDARWRPWTRPARHRTRVAGALYLQTRMSVPPPAAAPPPPPERPHVADGFAWWSPFAALVCAYAAAIVAGGHHRRGDRERGRRRPPARRDPQRDVRAGRAAGGGHGRLRAADDARLRRRPPSASGGSRSGAALQAGGARLRRLLRLPARLVAAATPSAKDDLATDLGAEDSTLALVAVARARRHRRADRRGAVLPRLPVRRARPRRCTGSSAALVTGLVFGARPRRRHAGDLPRPAVRARRPCCACSTAAPARCCPGMGVHAFNNALALGVSLHWSAEACSPASSLRADRGRHPRLAARRLR